MPCLGEAVRVTSFVNNNGQAKQASCLHPPYLSVGVEDEDDEDFRSRFFEKGFKCSDCEYVNNKKELTM